MLLAAPFVDQPGVDILSPALSRALTRGADITVIASPGCGALFEPLTSLEESNRSGQMRIVELHSEISWSGSHAKLVVVDRLRAYVGSANFTAAGFGKNIEVGVELAGVQVEELAMLLIALARPGHHSPISTSEFPSP